MIRLRAHFIFEFASSGAAGSRTGHTGADFEPCLAVSFRSFRSYCQKAASKSCENGVRKEHYITRSTHVRYQNDEWYPYTSIIAAVGANDLFRAS
jgi:hypothetical protein